MRTIFFFLTLLLVALSSCLKDEALKLNYTSFQPTEINDGWQISSPETENINRNKLEAAYRLVYEEERFPLAKSLLVFRNGKLVAEAYPSDKNDINRYHNLQSCTKTITSILMGVAMEQNLFDSTDEKLYNVFPELFDQDIAKREMTIYDALTMQSGIDFQNNKHTKELYSTDKNSTAFVLSLNRNYLPGTAYQYHDGAPHLISKAIEARTGKSLSIFANDNFFSKMNITNWKWEAAKDKTTFGAFSLYLTPRDFGKIGQLLLQNGVWDNQQLVNENYLHEATSNQFAGNPNNSPYGYYFWIYPDWKAYAAKGHGGQFLFVAPEKQLVVVYTAWPYSGRELWDEKEQLMKLILDSCD